MAARGFVLFGMFMATTPSVLGAADKPAPTPAVSTAGDKKTEAAVPADRQALTPLQGYIGQWKGVGQPRRGSNAGSWSEEADWAWQFSDGHAHLSFHAPQDKYYASAVLSASKETGSNAGKETAQFEWTGTQPDGKTTEHFAGTRDKDGQLVLLADKPEAGRPARITLRVVADGDRLLILYEQAAGEAQHYARLAEVGYTRVGATFAQGSGYPECVVTGGRGTIQVTYKGETYFVCCTGCRDLFNANPAAILAEYRERKAKEKPGAGQ